MINVFPFETSVDAYDTSQCDDEIKDGDVLDVASEKVIGILVSAWPVAITPHRDMNIGAFHKLADGANWRTFESGKYYASYQRAAEIYFTRERPDCCKFGRSGIAHSH